MRHLLLIPAVLIFLASCAPRTETVYEPPPLALAGGANTCIEQCDLQAIQCRRDASASVGACRAADAPISNGFNGCRAGSPGCVAAPICLADSNSCTEQYNSCFNSCGGLVRTIRTPYYNFDAMPSEPFVVPPLRDASGGAPAGRGQPIRVRRPVVQPAEF